MAGVGKKELTAAGIVIFMLVSVSAFAYPASAVMVPSADKATAAKEYRRSDNKRLGVTSKQKFGWFRRKASETGVSKRLAAGEINDGYQRRTATTRAVKTGNKKRPGK